MRALSIRQPFAELILRGIKTSEFRSRSTRIIGERFYIYASKGKLSGASCQLPVKAWSDDLRAGTPPGWMVELAEQIRMIEPELLGGAMLPTGVIVGSAVIEACTPVAGYQSLVAGGKEAAHFSPTTSDPRPPTLYQWHLTDVQRVKAFRKPKGHPQPVWFTPF